MRSIKSQHVLPGRKDTASKNICNSGLKSSSFDARHPGVESPPFFFRAELLGISRIDRTVFTRIQGRISTPNSNIRGCQSGTWSQRGTKVNGSHHGDNPLLRPTGIQIATKSYATLQAMAPTNNKTVHQTFFTPYREQPRSTSSSEVPRNPLTRWDVSSIPANGIFLTKKTKTKTKNAQRVEND